MTAACADCWPPSPAGAGVEAAGAGVRLAGRAAAFGCACACSLVGCVHVCVHVRASHMSLGSVQATTGRCDLLLFFVDNYPSNDCSY